MSLTGALQPLTLEVGEQAPLVLGLVLADHAEQVAGEQPPADLRPALETQVADA